jgi:hypothetical protein
MRSSVLAPERCSEMIFTSFQPRDVSGATFHEGPKSGRNEPFYLSSVERELKTALHRRSASTWGAPLGAPPAGSVESKLS